MEVVDTVLKVYVEYAEASRSPYTAWPVGRPQPWGRGMQFRPGACLERDVGLWWDSFAHSMGKRI
ncbi:hypothetical protein PABY_13840 [Pyrodictium abyssi]|uniref:Uncharacterized protein n=1 Tax=Pyrodictium abyssi TaxID=54256 RepID=A0ABN6ZU50_9CREN|nr:hypothetical protein PABY_13840 [Pyrodictium abyssi]